MLTKGLEARKEQRDFEHAVVRLLSELRTPAVWYGHPTKYQDAPDLASCVELNNDWIVLFGECTVQKPSDKFTLLLTRKNELDKVLQGEVRVLPIVFTSSTISSSDRKQALQDGIALVGASELEALMRGVDYEWGPRQVVEYLDGLLTVPLEFPIQFEN